MDKPEKKEKNKRSSYGSGLDFPAMEREVLGFWKKEKIFHKSLERTKIRQSFVFFEGPPTANGRPGIHHVLARAYKDVVLRYKTMRGFYVERKAGWDTHGLPVELQVEKELGISGKPEIEKYGIAKFNQRCRESVWKYKKEWERMTRQVGFWLDLDHPYITYKNSYIESLWWIIKQIWDKGLLYKGHKVVPHCPRCGTALSSHEVAQGYKSVEESSVYIKFPVVGEENTFILSWTTTPWTLPGNVALAVGKDIKYIRAKVGKETYILAENIADRIFDKFKLVSAIKGLELAGMEYQPIFDIPSLKSEKSYKVYVADFVNTQEGTGVVHTAVMYGEDDYRLGQEVGLPQRHTVDESGKFTKETGGLAGKFVKDKQTEREIIGYLQKKNFLYKEEMYRHDYPFCWRCDTPLLYYAKDSWFIRMSELREQLIKNNQGINWVPAYIKDGRFGEWLRDLKDWAISRERYWGTPLPVWQASDGEKICIGSIEELKKFAKDPGKINDKFDLHRPFVDEIVLLKDGKEFKRVKEVVDVWFDSGSMPFAQWHYPFENREKIDQGISFPAQYIAEAIDQTRGWFYTLLAISTLLNKGAPYQNVVCLNLILDSRGKKMSKSKGNIVDPFVMMNKYGADTLRWHLFTMNQPGDTKLFDEKQLSDVLRKNWMLLWNIVSFWKMYAVESDYKKAMGLPRAENMLDKWVLARLHQVIGLVTDYLDSYRITEAGRLLGNFINELSTWYVRRSRERFKKKGNGKKEALAVLHYVLVSLSKLLAPFIPFFSEKVFGELTRGSQRGDSVHLQDWPRKEEGVIDKKILVDMELVRAAVELGHSLRKENQLKVRQPLSQFIIAKPGLENEAREIIKEEMNVDEVICVDKIPADQDFAVKENNGVKVALDVTITDELRERGILRDAIRYINSMRRDAGLTVSDTITVYYETADGPLRGIIQHYKSALCREVIASACLEKLPEDVDLKEVLSIGGKKIVFGIKRN